MSVSALIIGEAFAGMRSQACGLAVRAEWQSAFHPVRPSRLSRLLLCGPEMLSRRCLADLNGVDLVKEAQKTAQVLISIGGKGGAAGAALSAVAGLPVVQIQHPRQALSRFNLILACVHDEISGPNVLLGRTALHGLTPEVLEQVRAEWMPRFAHLPRPLTAALVGGSNGRFSFGVREAASLGDALAVTTADSRGSLMVTPSRRTDPAALAVLTERVHAVGGEVWNGEGDNPYKGLIACADQIVVTTDSVSMVSEAVAGTAPVSVFPLPGRSRRIFRFVDELVKAGRVRLLESRAQRLPEIWAVQPLDDTTELVGEMHRRLAL